MSIKREFKLFPLLPFFIFVSNLKRILIERNFGGGFFLFDCSGKRALLIRINHAYIVDEFKNLKEILT